MSGNLKSVSIVPGPGCLISARTAAYKNLKMFLYNYYYNVLLGASRFLAAASQADAGISRANIFRISCNVA